LLLLLLFLPLAAPGAPAAAPWRGARRHVAAGDAAPRRCGDHPRDAVQAQLRQMVHHRDLHMRRGPLHDPRPFREAINDLFAALFGTFLLPEDRHLSYCYRALSDSPLGNVSDGG
ncbi:unnamed protein product, partial [Prorocentrum cordatum]